MPPDARRGSDHPSEPFPSLNGGGELLTSDVLSTTSLSPNRIDPVAIDLKYIYFSPADIQVPRVDRQGVVHFCEALHRIGVDIELVTLGITLLDSEVKADHPLDLYRIRERFPVRTVPTAIHQRTQDGRRTGITRLWVDATEAIKDIRRQPRDRWLLFFMKNYGPAAACLLLQKLTRKKVMVMFESHTVPRRSIQRFILKRLDGIIANSIALGDDLVKDHGVPAEKVLGIHQGIDLELIEENRISLEAARARLGLPQQKRLVVYTGKIYYGYKEVEYILDAARLMKGRDDVEFVMVGGRADHVENYRQQIAAEGLANVRFTGFVPVTEVQEYLSAADVLVMYYPTGIELNKYRSPGKLFEYMASGRPIVAADFPVLHEILGENPPAVLIPPDAPDALADALVSILFHRAHAEIETMTARALERVSQYSWIVRARKIMEYIERRAVAQRR